MTQFIILFGTLTCLAGLVILINPKIVFGFLRKNSNKIELHVLAVVIRLILGAFLIYQSDTSRYPFAIEIIGWVSIAAAVIFSLIGRANFCGLMAWALSQEKTLARFGGVIATTFGAFLIHAFA